MILKLKKIAVIRSVPFVQPNQTTLQASEGDLTFDTESGIATAKLHRPHSHRGDTFIPVANIAFFEPLVEKVEQPKPEAPPAPAPAAPVKSDVMKFVKDASGHIVEVAADPLVDAIAAADASDVDPQ